MTQNSPTSSREFAASVPVEAPGHAWLTALPLLIAVGAGAALLQVGPAAAGLGLAPALLARWQAGQRRPAPLAGLRAIRVSLEDGWRAQCADGLVSVVPCRGSVVLARAALLGLAGADGRRSWCIVRASACRDDDWRRLLVLWRRRHSSVVRHRPNC